MKIQSLFFFLLFSFLGTSLQAQIEGDDLFGQDQVVSVDLQFPSSNFWTTLVNNYDADENEYIMATLTLTDTYGVHVFDSIAVRLKGNSSYSHPGNKKSFKIDFNKFVVGQNYDGLKKLNFSNGFKDPSVIREKVFFDVCRAADIPAPRASFAEVTMNGQAWGFYTVIEQIDDQFLDWRIGDDDGNLFKAGDNFGGGPGGGGGGNEADLLDYGSDYAPYEARYELKTNEDLNNWSDLIDFIDFINNSTDEEFSTELDFVLEVDEYLRSVALDMLFSNLDSYTGSARNYYMYHNLTTNRWEWIKWDGNEAFGSYTNGAGNMLTLDIDYHNINRPLLERVFADEVLYERYLQEVCSLTEQFFNPTYMDNRIDEIKALVQAAVYADDAKMYSNAQFETNIESDLTIGGGPGGGTVYGLKPFVSSRSSYVSSQIDCSIINSIDEIDALEFNLVPNPASDYLTLSWKWSSNGQQAPSYQVNDS